MNLPHHPGQVTAVVDFVWPICRNSLLVLLALAVLLFTIEALSTKHLSEWQTAEVQQLFLSDGQALVRVRFSDGEEATIRHARLDSSERRASPGSIVHVLRPVRTWTLFGVLGDDGAWPVRELF